MLNNKKPFLDLPDEITEQLVINRLLLSKLHILSIITLFDERWFEVLELRVIAKIVVGYFKKFQKLPTLTILTNLIEKYSEVKELNKEKLIVVLHSILQLKIYDESPDFSNSVITEFIKRRGIYYTITDNLENIEKRKDASKIIGRFGDFSNFDIDQDLGLNGFDIESHRTATIVQKDRIPTGIKELDEQFLGGLPRNGKCLWVPIGMPGIGKTALITNLTKNFIKLGEKVLVITLEIDQNIYLQRIDANIIGSKVCNVNQNIDKIESFLSSTKQRNHNVGLMIKEFPPRSVTTAKVKMFIERLSLVGFKPTVILIDYLNLLLPFSISSDSGMYERVGAIAQEVRAMSYEFLAPVISPTQFNTEGYTGEPGMQHIAESRAVAHHADVLTSFWQTDVDREQNLINFKNIKNRIGGIINIKKQLHIDYDSITISSIEDKQCSKQYPKNESIAEKLLNL